MEQNNTTTETIDNQPTVPDETSVTPVTPTVPETSETPIVLPSADKSNKGLLIATIATSILAVAGIIFGIYGMTRPAKIDTFTIQVKDDEGTISELDKTKIDIDAKSNTIVIPDKLSPLGIDNDLAASVVNPYLRDLGAFSDILNNKFNENNKIRIAFQNMDPQKMLLSTSEAFRVSYDDLNNMYKYLFGSDTDLEKKNYNNQGFLYVAGESPSSDYFLVYPGGYGGTGLTKFTAIKGAYYEDERLVVEMYRDNLSWCGIVKPDPEVCVDANTWFSENDYEAKQKVIEKFSDKLTVKKMYFLEDNGHYILEDITD